uniref:Uncharacterized protein n=1 Tax=Chelonoidis abingdonii TaxID=106734 RepID=A0A8C0IW91_CHEAB
MDGNPVESLQQEATCPICLEYFTEPVTLECGHNFCRACIAQCWEGSDTAASCPQCRENVQQRNLRHNRQLANVVEIAKLLSLQAAKGARGDGVCERHQETLKLFCKEDQTPICVVCDRSRAHRTHTVVPIEEAAQEYKIVKIQNENISKLSEQISHLSERIRNEKPIKWLLLNRLKNCRNISAHTQVPRTEAAPWDPALSQPKRGLNVTLDPDTAHAILILSEDWKSVRWGDIRQRLQDNPERFDSDPCVLGCEGFTSGRHCWEVEVGGGRFWAVGVARESVRRKGEMNCSPKGGIWAVRRWWGQFRALTSPVTPLPLSWVPSRIRVCLDCDQGQVTFIDAGDGAPIFTFPPAAFSRERIRPCLCDPGDCFGSQPLHCQSTESIY